MSHIVIGTAGHIDHGKTSLVKALTGTNTDTLREEQDRKITIDLGFAFLGDQVTIIDVPGHERFIKNMVTGVSTIDFVLLVVAADDGIMPQTREHFDILKLLGIRHGMVVLTKASMADEDWIELVQEDLQEFLKGSFLDGAPIHLVDSISGAGIEELRKELNSRIEKLPRRESGGIFREYVDRAFSVKGHGTVITGTVLSGELHTGDEVEVLPSGKKARIRGIQVHGSASEQVQHGDRGALNLQGLSLDDVSRGDCIATPGVLKPGRLLDVQLSLLSTSPQLQMRDRVRLHIGTSEILARVVLLGCETLAPGSESLAQLRLEEPVTALRGDRFVLRRYSPAQTIGGGEVIDPAPPKHRPHASRVHQIFDLKESSLEVALTSMMRSAYKKIWRLADFQSRTGQRPEELMPVLAAMVEQEQLVALEASGQMRSWMETSHWKHLQQTMIARIQEYHKDFPEQATMPLAELKSRLALLQENKVFELLLHSQQEKLAVEQGGIRESSHSVQIPAALRTQMDQLIRSFKAGELPPPRPSDLCKSLELPQGEIRRLLNLCIREDALLALSQEVYLPPEDFSNVMSRIRTFAAQTADKRFSVSEVGQLLNAPRRFTVPLLEYTDTKNMTVRIDDRREFTS